MQLQEYVDDFKKSNLEIVSICEKICDSSLIHIEVHEPFEIDEFERYMEDYRYGIYEYS